MAEGERYIVNFKELEKRHECTLCNQHKTIDKLSEELDFLKEKKANEFFNTSTGGNNRKWTKRYMYMKNKLDILKEMSNGSDEMINIIKGYQMCVDTFEDRKI